MTFGLFANIASRAIGKHIHKYVPASGSISGYIRHPAPIPGHPTIPSGGTVIPTQIVLFTKRLAETFSVEYHMKIFMYSRIGLYTKKPKNVFRWAGDTLSSFCLIAIDVSIPEGKKSLGHFSHLYVL